MQCQRETNAGVLQGCRLTGNHNGLPQSYPETKKVSHDIRLDAINLLTAIRDHDPVADDEDRFWIESAVVVLDRLMVREAARPRDPPKSLDYSKCLHNSVALGCPLRAIGMICGSHCGALTMPSEVDSDV